MIWLIIFIILLISKIIFNANYQFSKNLGIIWYTFNNKRKYIVLWGTQV